MRTKKIVKLNPIDNLALLELTPHYFFLMHKMNQLLLDCEVFIACFWPKWEKIHIHTETSIYRYIRICNTKCPWFLLPSPTFSQFCRSFWIYRTAITTPRPTTCLTLSFFHLNCHYFSKLRSLPSPEQRCRTAVSRPSIHTNKADSLQSVAPLWSFSSRRQRRFVRLMSHTHAVCKPRQGQLLPTCLRR